MFISPVTETEMEQLIKSLKNSSSGSFDDIQMFLAKQCFLFY